MKNFKLMAVALVAMFGLTACNNDCEHEFIEYDYSEALVGTWTCLEEDQSEAMVINPDGSFEVTGVMKGGALYEEKGTIKVVNNKVSLAYNSGDVFEGRFELVAGKSMSIVLNEEYDIRLTYDYCENDLSEEIVGMWVCNDGTAREENGIVIHTYTESGKTYLTTATSAGTGYFAVNEESEYKVIGDLMFLKLMHKTLDSGVHAYAATKLTYTPNATSAGDIMTLHNYMSTKDGFVKEVNSFLRVKQSLDLAGQKYDYIKTYVSNVKGLDKDINFMGFEFNFAKMDGVKLDKMLKALLFNVEFPDANTIKYACHYNNEPMSMEAPIVVDGNKMTVKMSTKNAAYKDIDLYTFQDKDNTQMHMYMPTYAFINFFGNMQVTIMEQLGQLDTTDAAAVKAVFDSIDNAVETINVSFVMTKAK